MTDPNDGTTTDDTGADFMDTPCAMCGQPLWTDPRPPDRDGDRWICGECDAARNFEALDLD